MGAVPYAWSGRDGQGNVRTGTGSIATSAPPPPSGLKIVGMSSPAPDWDLRLSQVGPLGITARRIFVPSLNSSGSGQMDLVEDAHTAGMMPVFSFKVPSVTTALSGGYDSWVQAMVNRLVAFNKTTTVTFAHEPYGDLTGAQFTALNRRWAPIIQASGLLKFGPFVNGWLLDNKVADFTSFTRDGAGNLLDVWDFFGIDTYEEGTIEEEPGSVLPGDRIPKLMDWLSSQGYPNKQVGIGEYNGYSGSSIGAAGEAILSCPNVWFACMWNATTGKGYVLEGERLAAFKNTKADPRVRK